MQAQHTQQGAIVQVPIGEVTGSDADRHRGQQRREQGHQGQETLGAVQRLAHLRTSRFQTVQAHATQAVTLDLVLKRLAKARKREFRCPAPHRIGGHDHQPVGDPAGRLDQPCGLKVILVQHHPR